MKNDVNYNLITRYVAGECSEEEAFALESRMKNDSELAKIVEELQNIWDAKNQRPNSWDVESAWKRFNRELARTQKTHQKKPTRSKPILEHKRPGKSWFLRITAVFMVVGLTGLFALLSFDEGEEMDEFITKEVITEKGQRIQIQLDDGSRIQLNADSKITYPEFFESDSRTVHLSGEAYFEVYHDERPFIVHTDGVAIEILGTKFNVQAYEEESIEVVVADGKVGVKLSEILESETNVLERGDMARMDRAGNGTLSVYRDVDIQNHLGWLEHRLTFDDVTMDRVTTQLERWYGVDIEITDPTVVELALSANFENESLQEVLRVIKLALNIEYELEGRQVTFYKSPDRVTSQYLDLFDRVNEIKTLGLGS